MEWRLEFEIFFAKILLTLNLPTRGDILSHAGMGILEMSGGIIVSTDTVARNA